MKRNRSAEDYLECILLLSRENKFVHRVDVARKTGVSQPAVQKAVKLLQNDGYLECDGVCRRSVRQALHHKKIFTDFGR